jgi:RimJ/RimL family protein N-acetyltransferase
MPSNKPDPPPRSRTAEGAGAAMRLRDAGPDDIPFIVGLEQRPDYRAFINSSPAGRHRAALSNADFRYLIFEGAGARLGFAILTGLTSPNRSIQLMRTAVDRPGQGVGRRLCARLLKEVFETMGAHRIHLDLFEGNHRAERLYLSLGFRHEGVLREAERRGDTYRSLKVMSLLEDEYRRTGGRRA